MQPPKPKKSSFKADDKGLKLAKSVADAMSIDMDIQATQKLADELHSRYYRAIVDLIEPSEIATTFESGSLRRVNAFAENALGEQLISFDEQLDFWLMTCCHLATVATCKVLTGTEFETLASVFAENLETVLDPYNHERMRANFAPFLKDYTDLLELSHALSRAMIVFVICHELAHVRLGHTALPPGPDKEFAADEMAAKFFLKIIDAREGAALIFVHKKLVVAPIVMMQFWEVLYHYKAMRTGYVITSSTHPHPSARGELLKKHLSSRLDNDAVYLLDGLTAGIKDITRRLGLAG